MERSQSKQRRSQFDGKQLVVFVHLPPGQWTTGDLYEHVYGVRLEDGAKPWPYFRDPRTAEWWSLSTPDGFPVDALVWMIDLDQLAYRSLPEARAFLEGVLPELEARAARFGGTVEVESTVAEALDRMEWVREMLRVRDYQVTIVVAAPERHAYSVGEWWQALEGVGLQLGDGDLFWRLNEHAGEGNSEPYELYCAEPYSRPGYFHPGDVGGSVRFPDVALHFRARDLRDPVAMLCQMARSAEELARLLGGARVLTSAGEPFDLAAAERDLRGALETLQALQRT